MKVKTDIINILKQIPVKDWCIPFEYNLTKYNYILILIFNTNVIRVRT